MSAPPTLLRWGRLSAEITPQWSELLDIVAKADDHEEVYTPEDLAEELDSTGFDPGVHSFAAWSRDQLIGVATVHSRSEPRFDGYGQISFDLAVHPNWRGRGIEPELLDCCEKIAPGLADSRTPGVDYVTGTHVRGSDPTLLALLDARGYRHARTYHDMQRPVSRPGSPLPDMTHPLPGVTVSAVHASDEEAVRLAHNDAFRQHWGAGPRGAVEWHEMMESRTTRLEASRIAIDADGQVLSYALVAQWAPGELFVLLVGTRRDYQHRGLARAVLSEVLRAADAGSGGESVQRVDLDVDSDSPTEAGRLYTGFGFQTVRSHAVYQRLDKAR